MAVKEARPTFPTEAALCASFSTSVAKQGWTIYPETSGWDLLLVKEGTQVGVQAKLLPNIKVLAQALPEEIASRSDGAGPPYAALVVGHTTPEFERVAFHLGLLVIQPYWRKALWQRDVETPPPTAEWPDLSAQLLHVVPRHFDEPAWLPDMVPAVPAGVPCPVRLTAWKYQALRLLARLAVRGYVTGQDFAEIGLNRSRWYHAWLVPAPGESRPPGAPMRLKGEHGPQRWVKAPGVRLADDQHPDVFASILAATRADMERREKEPGGSPLRPDSQQPGLFLEDKNAGGDQPV